MCLKDKIENKKLWIIRKVKKDFLWQIEAADFSNFKIWQAGRNYSISIPYEKIINKSKDSPLFGKGKLSQISLMLRDALKSILSVKVFLSGQLS